MGNSDDRAGTKGKWLALTAALLGWMFDGLEMGLFPLVARPAIKSLLTTPDYVPSDTLVGLWFSVATAGFLVGAATGGVLFGWLGDRIGRVRAMTYSVFTYAVVSALCGLATAPWQIAVLRSIAALGMGGEWALGVALVMEVWPNRSRAVLAGVIGAAANLGYMLVAVIDLSLRMVEDQSIANVLMSLGLPADWAGKLVESQRWRLLMLLGAAPALLTFFIRLFVPESERWQQEKRSGKTNHWATQDLVGVLIGAMAAAGLISLWAMDFHPWIRLPGTAVALVVITFGYLYPLFRYQHRMGLPAAERGFASQTVRRMLLGACISGVALLGTWASMQWASTWADQLTGGQMPTAKAYTQFWSALGAVFGTILGALLGDWIGRRPAYCLLCISALGASLLFYRGNTEFGPQFLATAFLAGAMTASFYGWLPLYLPELFPTAVRATGQGFSFNFGRNLAAVGTLQTGVLVGALGGGYPQACSVMSLVYLVGAIIIWFAPETRGKPLPL